MKQYNIEEQLQRKLKERSITPSAEAWGRIAYNRQQQQKNKKKYSGWYWAVAAVLLLSLGGLLLATVDSNNSIALPQQKVVDKQTKPNSVETAPETVLSKEVRNEVVLQEHKNSINTADVAEKQLPARPEATAVSTLPTAEIVKANEVAIAIHELALSKNGQVTDNEVDSLLTKARMEIALERLKNKNLPTDDTALLNAAEKEMENSFRDKTLSIFKLKFKTIKIAFKDKQ